MIGRFYEVESGAVDARPELMKALDLVRETGAHLCFQKVDRLSRDVEFIARLVKDPKVHLRVANLPNADSFQIHLFAALGFAEREFISQRTRVAMAAAKAKGKRFGNPRIGDSGIKASGIGDSESGDSVMATPLFSRKARW